MTKASGYVFVVNGARPPNTTWPATTTASSSSAASNGRRRMGVTSASRHSSTTGAIRMSPAASPSHHVSHTGAAVLDVSKPPASRLATPMVALTAALGSAARPTKRTMSRACSKARAPWAQRRARSAPAMAASVLPVAIASEVPSEPVVATLTRNAAMKIAGHMPAPNSRTPASAMPAGGHTGLALALRKAKCCSPAFPTRKYTTASSTSRSVIGILAPNVWLSRASAGAAADRPRRRPRSESSAGWAAGPRASRPSTARRRRRASAPASTARRA